MDEDYRWPKKGDNPFLDKLASPNSPTWASLEWLDSWRFDDSFLAGAFREAGDKIIDNLNKGDDSQHPDKFFMPITYLYRHCLELKMKHIIRVGLQLELINKDDRIDKILIEHKLQQLWNVIKKIIEKLLPGESIEGIEAVGRIIQEFHKIDKSGQNLRYSQDKSGKSTLKQLPKSVELTDLKDVFSGIYNFLNGCEASLEHDLELRNEMLSDCM